MAGLTSWSKLAEENLMAGGSPRGRAYYKVKDVWYELYLREEVIPRPPDWLLTEAEAQLLTELTLGLKEQAMGEPSFDIFESAANFQRFLTGLIILTKDCDLNADVDSVAGNIPAELHLLRKLADKLVLSK
jgi:hypothetical protein